MSACERDGQFSKVGVEVFKQPRFKAGRQGKPRCKLGEDIRLLDALVVQSDVVKQPGIKTHAKCGEASFRVLKLSDPVQSCRLVVQRVIKVEENSTEGHRVA